MGDYLWDKKGEPDAEVERLEALLGAMAHKSRPLELPAAAVPAPGAGFARRPSAPAWLAAAAALLLASLVVATVYLRERVTPAGGAGATLSAPQTRADAPRQTPRPAERTRAVVPPPPVSLVSETVRPAAGHAGGLESSKGSPAEAGEVARARRRQKGLQPAAARRPATPGAEAETRPDGGFALEALRARTGAEALVETTRLLTKEQLVYALRLTGAKLRDVRERAQGPDGLK